MNPGGRCAGVHVGLSMHPKWLAVVSESDVPRLGICWDLGHDARNGATPPPPGFVERVTHVHVHDVSPRGADHYPLLAGSAPWRDGLRRLHRAGYRGALILEVNGHSVARVARDRGTSSTEILRESFREMLQAFSP